MFTALWDTVHFSRPRSYFPLYVWKYFVQITFESRHAYRGAIEEGFRREKWQDEDRIVVVCLAGNQNTGEPIHCVYILCLPNKRVLSLPLTPRGNADISGQFANQEKKKSNRLQAITAVCTGMSRRDSTITAIGNGSSAFIWLIFQLYHFHSVSYAKESMNHPLCPCLYLSLPRSRTRWFDVKETLQCTLVRSEEVMWVIYSCRSSMAALHCNQGTIAIKEKWAWIVPVLSFIATWDTEKCSVHFQHQRKPHQLQANAIQTAGFRCLYKQDQSSVTFCADSAPAGVCVCVCIILEFIWLYICLSEIYIIFHLKP